MFEIFRAFISSYFCYFFHAVCFKNFRVERFETCGVNLQEQKNRPTPVFLSSHASIIEVIEILYFDQEGPQEKKNLNYISRPLILKCMPKQIKENERHDAVIINVSKNRKRLQHLH